MKQIVDKLNKIAKKINENVELSDRDLIIDSLDSITKAYGGTPNDSTLIVDKLDDIYNNIGPAVSGNIEITENGENINVAPYATATVNVSGGGTAAKTMPISIVNNTSNIVFLEVPSWLNSGYLVGGIEIPANDTATINANIFYVELDELYSVLLNGSALSSQNAEYDEVNSTASYATLDFDGAYCEIDLTSPPNPDAVATIYIIDAN